MTDKLHNHIAGMVCETDEPGKPADVTAARYLIWKQGAFYRPNSRGYTTSAIQAGRYTLDDAIDITHPNGPDGPRDGMSYVHEDEVFDADWQAYQTLAAVLAEQTARAEAAEAREKALIEEGAKLSAWQCIFTDGKTGLVCDEGGGQFCAMQARVAELTAKLEAFVRAGAKPKCGHPFCGDECGAPAPSPDVPTPPDGWNVMKLGQVGWHVVQSANGWETSRIFGAECLLRSGGGDEFGPALDATPDGGRVAADAPTPSPHVGAQIAAAVKAEREVWVDAAMRLMSEARYLDLMIVASELREARALAAIQATP